MGNALSHFKYSTTVNALCKMLWWRLDGCCAKNCLMPPQTLRKPISKSNRQPDNPTIRQPALHKETTKPNKPKAGQSATWPTYPCGNDDFTCQRNIAMSEHVPAERRNFESRKRSSDINRMATEHHEHDIKHVTGAYSPRERPHGRSQHHGPKYPGS